MIASMLRRYPGPFSRAVCLVLAVIFSTAGSAWAQQNPIIPNFWDPQERFIKPNVKDLPRLRFLTTTDFPPFSYIDKDKRLTGFHVDLARAICAELEVLPVCQIQALPFDELQKRLAEKRGEAIIAGLAADQESRKILAFTRPYFWLPARFVAKTSAALAEPLSEALRDKEIAVVDGTSHAAMALGKFGNMRVRLFDTLDAALQALQQDKVAAVYGDGLTLSFWLQSGKAEANCCKFVGKAYLSPDYLGTGLAIGVAKEERELQRALNYALRAVNDRGTFAELYLRDFPIGLF
jgi:polar amino acid transport system substrate-binding protein